MSEIMLSQEHLKQWRYIVREYRNAKIQLLETELKFNECRSKMGSVENDLARFLRTIKEQHHIEANELNIDEETGEITCTIAQ